MDASDPVAAFERYLQRRFPERRTTIDYLSDVRQFRAVCAKPWREVTMHDIDAFVDQQQQAQLQASTIKRRVAALKTYFDFLAEDSGELERVNPVRFKRHAGKPPSACRATYQMKRSSSSGRLSPRPGTAPGLR